MSAKCCRPLLTVEEPELQRRTSPRAKKALENASRLIKWATRDKKKLEQLVRTLKNYNDSLNHLASSIEQASMRRSLRTRFISANQLEQLWLLQESANLVGHEDLRVAASAKGFVKEIFRDEDVSAAMQSTSIDDTTDSKAPDLERAQDLTLDSNRLRYEDVAIFGAHSRTSGTYTYPDGRRENVIVDWTRCRDDSWRRKHPDAFKARAVKLARVLNKDLLPKGFSVLRCIGYLNATNTTTGYLFRTPDHALAKTEPISLHQILGDARSRADIPVLGDRFDLAKAVVTTVFEFHNIGWMHKNLNSMNVLFWPSKDCNNEIDLRKPYLVGFELSRSNQPDEISEKPVEAEEDDLYRHPSYKGENATDFQPSYDYFSLGVLLFEIAMWRLISQPQTSRSSPNPSGTVRRKSSAADADFIRKTVMGLTKDLGRFVGARYRDAILACIELEFDTVWEKAAEEDRDLILQQAVQKRVIDAIDSCQA